MTQPIPSKPTEYNGTKFRSRLEARWAFWFDSQRVEWQYEPHMLLVPRRLSAGTADYVCTIHKGDAACPGGCPMTKVVGGPTCWTLDGVPAFEATESYLPDFWLPELGVYAEVKGSLTFTEYVRLLDIAAGLSSPSWGDNSAHPEILVLGNLPNDHWNCYGHLLSMRKGVLEVHHWGGALTWDRSEPSNPGRKLDLSWSDLNLACDNAEWESYCDDHVMSDDAVEMLLSGKCGGRRKMEWSGVLQAKRASVHEGELMKPKPPRRTVAGLGFGAPASNAEGLL